MNIAFFQRNKWQWAIFISLVGVALLLLSWIYVYAVERTAQTEAVVLQIEKSASGRDIAERLEEKGVIRSARIFRWALFFTGESKKLQSGYYYLPPHLTVRDVILELKSGKSEMVKVTVPEGSTVLQIHQILEKAGVTGAADFLSVAKTYAPLPYMERREGVSFVAEGFLFADTYYVPKDYTGKEICQMMYGHTDKNLTEEIRREAEEKGMSLYDLMTLSSMVEREAKFPEDRPLIASVMKARLEKDMPLQIDATVQYALGETKAELSLGDTKIASPYNTYLQKGLPPGPIASPGMDAIRAVLSAEPGDFLYYVAQPDGHHIFTKTLEEHEEAIRTIYGT